MKCEVKEVAPCRKSIKVEIPAEKVDACFDETFGILSANVQIKGFRRGHAPRKILERKYQKEVEQDVRNKLFQDSFGEAMKENDISPMGDPDIKIEELEARPGEAFAYETEVDIRPKFDLPEYKGLKLVEKVEPVSDKEIDEQIDNLREHFTNYEPVGEKSKQGDIIEADVVAKAGDEELINEKAQRVKVDGEKIFGLEYKSLVKKLSGLAAGDEASLEVSLPDDFHKEDLRGKKAKISLKVTQILRGELPEVDDSFAQRLGMKDVDTLRDQIKSNRETELKQAARQQVEQDAVDQLIEQCSFELPEEFMKRQTQAALMRSTMQLARMGATKEYLEEQKDQLEKTSKEETERSIRRSIIFDAIGEKEEIEVTEMEFQRHIEMLARNYNTTPAKMIKRIQDNNGITAMAAEIRDIKVTQLIMDSAEITQEEGSK